MAITQTGTSQRFALASGAANAGTLSSTITVPADAQIAIVAMSSFNGSGTYFTTGSVTFTKGGADTAMTIAVSTALSTSLWQGVMWYLVLPDTGSNKSLKYDWAGAGATAEVSLFSLRFYTGVDTTGAVRDGDMAQAGAIPYTTPTLTAQTGDLIVATACWFGQAVAPGNGLITGWTNLTASEHVTDNEPAEIDWAEGSPMGDTTVSAATETGDVNDGGIVAVVLIPAAEVAAVTLMGAMVGPIIRTRNTMRGY